MSEPRFTPGPWEMSRMRLGPKETDRRCGFVVNGSHDDADGLRTRICDLRVPPGIDGFSEGEANAALIASAPALYAACEAIQQALDMDDVPADWLKRRADLRAALAAARGRESEGGER